MRSSTFRYLPNSVGYCWVGSLKRCSNWYRNSGESALKCWRRWRLPSSERHNRVQHQVYTGAFPGHIVVQVSVKPLVAPVDLRGQADQQGVNVEGSQAKCPG